MRILLAILFLVCFALNGFSQDVIAQVEKDKAYINVLISGFGNWNALSQLWQIPEAALIKANPNLEPGVYTGNREIKIPISDIIKDENCVDCKPVYHKVRQSEGLYRIGLLYGNTNAAKLKKMNNLRSDALQPGQKLLVGYVNLPNADITTDKANNTGNASGEKPIPLSSDNNTLTQKVELSVKDTVEKIDPVVFPEHILRYEGTGFFETEYEASKKTGVKKEGKAASFKSESGWDDGKFYLLNNQLKTGSIVKIQNPANGNYLYAKVVGPLPNIKQNTGLQYRISNAAAMVLGFWNETDIFEINLEY